MKRLKPEEKNKLINTDLFQQLLKFLCSWVIDCESNDREAITKYQRSNLSKVKEDMLNY
jgi:hypothetical protein